jgi:hypothetical protein
MATVINEIINEIKTNVSGLKGLDSMNDSLKVFQQNARSFSGQKIFDISDSVNQNIVSLKEQLRIQAEAYKFASKGPVAGIKPAEKMGMMKGIVEDIGDINKELRIAQTEMSILTSETRKFGGTKDNFNFLSNAVKKTGYNFGLLNNFMQQNNWIATKNGKIFQRNTNTYIAQSKAIDIMRKKLWRFNMNMLTVMFASMAINRYISQFGRSAITTFQKANEDTVGLGKSTWHLIAAWEFFKYSLVDALTQSPLFQLIVKWLLQVVNWLNKLSPETKSLIALGLAFVFMASAIAVAYSQLQPFFSLMLSKISTSGGIFAVTGKLLLIVAILYLGYEAIKSFWGQWNDGADMSVGELDIFTSSLQFIIRIISFIILLVRQGAKVIASSIKILIFIISDIINQLFLFIKMIGFLVSYGLNRFDYFGVSVRVIFKTMFNILSVLLSGFFNFFIDGINRAISGVNALGASIPEIPSLQPDFIDMTEDINELKKYDDALKEIKDNFNMEKRVSEEIRNTLQGRAFQELWSLSSNTFSLAELWDQTSLNAAPQKPSENIQNAKSVQNNNNLEIGNIDIDIDSAVEGVVKDVDSLTDILSNKIMEKINDNLSRKSGAVIQ